MRDFINKYIDLFIYEKHRFILYLKERKVIRKIIATTTRLIIMSMGLIRKTIELCKTDYNKNYFCVDYQFLDSILKELLLLQKEVIFFPKYIRLLEIIERIKFNNSKLRTYLRRSLDDYYMAFRDEFNQYLYDSNSKLDIIKRCIKENNEIDYLK